jgi:hypothetical protein
MLSYPRNARKWVFKIHCNSTVLKGQTARKGCRERSRCFVRNNGRGLPVEGPERTRLLSLKMTPVFDFKGCGEASGGRGVVWTPDPTNRIHGQRTGVSVEPARCSFRDRSAGDRRGAGFRTLARSNSRECGLYVAGATTAKVSFRPTARCALYYNASWQGDPLRVPVASPRQGRDRNRAVPIPKGRTDAK